MLRRVRALVGPLTAASTWALASTRASARVLVRRVSALLGALVNGGAVAAVLLGALVAVVLYGRTLAAFPGALVTLAGFYAAAHLDGRACS